MYIVLMCMSICMIYIYMSICLSDRHIDMHIYVYNRFLFNRLCKCILHIIYVVCIIFYIFMTQLQVACLLMIFLACSIHIHSCMNVYAYIHTNSSI